MKKFLAIILVLICAVLACSCDDQDEVYVNTSFTVEYEDGNSALREFDENGAERKTLYDANGKTLSIQEINPDKKLVKFTVFNESSGKLFAIHEYMKTEILLKARFLMKKEIK